MKKLMIGNEAIARGAYEAGIKVVSSYPGTPSTEITEFIAGYDEVYAEWAPNEKVAMEVAAGASVAGVRTMVCMKHVGMNVAADPMFTFAYTGVNGGAVIVVADDPGMHSSQNEQDSRFYARSAHIPMLEPSDSDEARRFVKTACEISERYDTPVILRTTTRLAHSQSTVTFGERVETETKPYVKDITKYAMMPASAIKRHLAVEARENRLKAEQDKLNLDEIHIKGKDFGVVCSGVVYQYVKEALPDASVYKVGMVYPLNVEAIRKFSESVKELIVIEELEPFFENQLKANGIACSGKDKTGLQGELNVNKIKKAVYGFEENKPLSDLPVRPPMLCAGCPHRSVFFVLNKLGCTVTGDIGCYTLGAQPPLRAIDTVLCMGASVSMAHGFEKALGRENTKNQVAVIGDSTFIHSGITGLINAVYNKSNITLVILDNRTTGMTGHQDNPATGKTLKGERTYELDFVTLAKALNVPSVVQVGAYDLILLEETIKGELNKDCVSVIVVKQPCVLLDKSKKPFLRIDGCVGCKRCMKLGCPAMSLDDTGRAVIDKTVCVACGVCKDMCKVGAIKEA